VGASALLSLVVIAGAASAQVIDSPGRYEVTVVAVPDFTAPGFPTVGPNAYAGEVHLVEAGNSWNVTFQGETESGEKLVIQAKFDSDWNGIQLGPFPVDGQLIQNAVISIDIDNLEQAHVQGEGLINGQLQRLNGRVGPGGTVEHVQIH
jgi:hypothetical protein